MVATLQNVFELPVFGTAAAEFTPLGDHDGLQAEDVAVERGRLLRPKQAARPC